MCQRGVRESPPGILGAVILVISGPGRMMYRSLEPKPEGSIYRKRSSLRERHRPPHDTATSMSNWLAIGSYKGTPLRASPRADPYVRNYRIRLLLRVFGEETLVRIRLQDLGVR